MEDRNIFFFRKRFCIYEIFSIRIGMIESDWIFELFHSLILFFKYSVLGFHSTNPISFINRR